MDIERAILADDHSALPLSPYVRMYITPLPLRANISKLAFSGMSSCWCFHKSQILTSVRPTLAPITLKHIDRQAVGYEKDNHEAVIGHILPLELELEEHKQNDSG